MKSYPKKEIERIRHTTISKMHFFIIEMLYRNMHAHTDMEILLQLEGSLHIVTADEEFDISPGDVALFHSNQPHSCHALSERCCALVLQIDLTFCIDYFPDIYNVRFSSSNLSALVHGEQMDELKEACYNIGYNFFSQMPAFEFRCISDVNRLFSFLLTNIPHRIISDEEYLSALNFEKRMERIVSYVEKKYMEKISLAEIAEKEGLTTSYLSHFFKDNLHMNFQTYVNSLRFDHALYLLRKTDMRIIDICLQSGFSDSKYLNKMFQHAYGMTPKEFREKQKAVEVIPSDMQTEQSKQNEFVYSIEDGFQILRNNFMFPCDNEANQLVYNVLQKG